MTIEDEDLLLAVLNSAPLVGGEPTDDLAGPDGAEWVRRFGGSGSTDEIRQLRGARDAVQTLIRDVESDRTAALAEISDALHRTVRVPRASASGVEWDLRTPDDDRLAVRVILAWSAVQASLPGRLRACANTECNLFLIDHSRPGTARWCSMAACGNRHKARAHAERARRASATV